MNTPQQLRQLGDVGGEHVLVKQLSQAKSFEQIMRVQMEFMQSQATAFGEHLKTLDYTFAARRRELP